MLLFVKWTEKIYLQFHLKNNNASLINLSAKTSSTKGSLYSFVKLYSSGTRANE